MDQKAKQTGGNYFKEQNECLYRQIYLLALTETDFMKEVLPHYLSKYFLEASIGILTTKIQAIFAYSKASNKSLALKNLKEQLIQSKKGFK